MFKEILTNELKYPLPEFGGKRELQDYRCRIYSQNGEEGILCEIFKRIEEDIRFFVEFGAGDGLCGSNSALFRKKMNWDGLLLEANEKMVEKAQKDGCENIHLEFITSDNINDIFNKYKVPSKFSFLSIDIDGNDIYILEALDTSKYSPNVIIVEFNPGLPNKFPIRVVECEKFPSIGDEPVGYFGANLVDFYEVAENKGYQFVTTVAWNAIFVKNELFDKLNIPKQTKDQIIYHCYGEGFDYWSKIIHKYNFNWLVRNENNS